MIIKMIKMIKVVKMIVKEGTQGGHMSYWGRSCGCLSM